MRLSRTVQIAVALAALSLATGAEAHARLRSSDPAANSTLRQRPAALRLVFSEPVVAAFSGLRLADAAGRPVQAGRSGVDPKDRRALVLPLKAPLAPGQYTVRWHAVTSDTHRVEGGYGFRVAG
jgi:methionine-rich copper-binding protein CopC